MKRIMIYGRNKIIGLLYKGILKQIFFRVDPEIVHNRMIRFGSFLGSHTITKNITRFFLSYTDKRLGQHINGIFFSNPIGLAAGFDKDAQLADILPSVGFGFAELGSVTGEFCAGNPKPRLWRLKKSKALVIYYGLKNKGSVLISEALRDRIFKIPVGISIAKTNNKETVALDAGINDYVKAYRKFTAIGSYFTINISCPNAFGGQPFTDPYALDKLLTEIDKISTSKPIFLKMSPDLDEKEVNAILNVVKEHHIAGFICTNLTKNRKNKKIIDELVPQKGGISGNAVKELSNNLIRYIYHKTNGQFIIIGCGGVCTAEDAYEKIKAGASLIQLITGMIFEGPQLISDINLGLVRLLKRDGFNNISQAIGANYTVR